MNFGSITAAAHAELSTADVGHEVGGGRGEMSGVSTMVLITSPYRWAKSRRSAAVSVRSVRRPATGSDSR